MSEFAVSRAFVKIDGEIVEAESATWKATKETTVKKPMRRQRKPKGRTRAVPDYELTMEFSLYENDGLLRRLLSAFQNEEELPVTYELENSDILRFIDCAVNDIDQSNSEGDGATVTITMDAMDLTADDAQVYQ
jgi:hypothetical protein